LPNCALHEVTQDNPLQGDEDDVLSHPPYEAFDDWSPANTEQFVAMSGCNDETTTMNNNDNEQQQQRTTTTTNNNNNKQQQQQTATMTNNDDGKQRRRLCRRQRDLVGK